MYNKITSSGSLFEIEGIIVQALLIEQAPEKNMQNIFQSIVAGEGAKGGFMQQQTTTKVKGFQSNNCFSLSGNLFVK